ncbi:MAG: gluconate 2-dehydrogenase subunit 3 family protein [Saprospiraceae bacterium]|nr:gluconate 2-dehydrogenase subunit 3 family protein [Saprospiraceae bacterium]
MKQNNPIDRREMLKTLTLLTGYTITAGAASAFLAGCKNDPGAAGLAGSVSVLSDDQIKTLAAIVDRIIPKTDTPGAVDAGVEQYIALAVNKFYKAEDQKKFLENFARFDKLATDKYKKTFAQLSDQNKDDILKILAEEWKKNEKDPHIFKEIRDLTVTGYCTSEAGAKQLLKYDPIPGPYKGMY